VAVALNRHFDHFHAPLERAARFLFIVVAPTQISPKVGVGFHPDAYVDLNTLALVCVGPAGRNRPSVLQTPRMSAIMAGARSTSLRARGIEMT